MIDPLWWRQIKAHAYGTLVIGTFLGIIPWALTRGLGINVVPWPDLFPAPYPMILGALLAVAGGALSYTCMIVFVVRGKGTAFPTDPPKQFVALGPYRWTRNPMYLGNLVLATGVGTFFASTTYLSYVLVLAVVTHFYVVMSEEPHLKQRFGRTYLDYLASTPRWLVKQPAPQESQA